MSIEEFNNNFIKIYDNPITLNDTIDDDNVLVYAIDYTTCYIFDIKDIYEDGRIKRRFMFDTKIKKSIYTSDCLKFTRYYCDSILFPYLKWNNPYKSSEIFNEIFYSPKNWNSDEFLKANFITRLEKIDNKYYIVNYGNKKILERILLNKIDSKTTIFMDLLYSSIKSDIKFKCEKELYNILHKDVDKIYINENINLPLLKDNIKLYEYQKNDLKWMNLIKSKIDNNDNILSIEQSLFHYKKFNNDEEYLIYNNIILPKNHDNLTTKFNIKYYGGNIVSEVGLGKTLIVLSHILHSNENKFNNYVEFVYDKCNYFYKRGKNKTLNCDKNICKDNELYCKEHSNTLFIDKRTIRFKNLNTFNLRDYIITSSKNVILDKDDAYNNDNYYLKTNASLIICPNQLCDQWVREYYDKFKQTSNVAKRILLIVTYDQYKNLSLGDILFADLIIVSYNFLLNKNYIACKRENLLTVLDDLDRDETINSIDDLLNTRHSHLNILNNYYYNGIYLDENHEILSKPRSDILRSIIMSFKSDYKWNISATPFANGLNSFIYNTSFTTNLLNSNDILQLHENTIKSLSILYRRNTKESIRNELHGNIITETIELLEFTDQERSIYDAHMQGNFKNNRNFLIKLCCDTSIDLETRHLVKNCKTLDEIQTVILNHNKKKLNVLSNKMIEHTCKIDNLLIIINRGYILDEKDIDGEIFENIEQVKVEIGIFRRKLTNDKKEYDTINRTYTYLKNAINNIKETEPCPICLDDIDNDNIAITKCGHKFCKDCINEFIEELNTRYHDIKCPKCNIVIQTSEIYLLKDVDNLITTQENNELIQLIEKFKSTKIGNIIYYVKYKMHSNDKCIIFSQWDNMLTKIGTILEQENINVLYCSGTVYQRKRAITKFQNDAKSNIICLSSENCASGINLTSANKIIFIEPIYGNKDFRKDIENQAIGRADRIGQTRPIEIIRFIIKNSIEHEILLDNHSENTNTNTNTNNVNIEINDNILTV